MSLDEIAETYLGDVDLILTEGYKSGPKMKIEVSRRQTSQQLISSPPELMAVVADQQFDIITPHFNLDDASGVADLIEEGLLIAQRG